MLSFKHRIKAPLFNAMFFMRSPAQSGMTVPSPNATKGKPTLPLRPVYMLVNDHHLAGFAGLHNRIDDLQTAKALFTSAARHRFLAQAKIDEVVSL